MFALPGSDEERPTFTPLAPPSHDEVEDLLARVVLRVRRCMARHFEGRDDEVASDVLSVLAAKSAAGERGADASVDERPRGRFEAFLDGVLFALRRAPARA